MEASDLVEWRSCVMQMGRCIEELYDDGKAAPQLCSRWLVAMDKMVGKDGE